MTIEAAQDLKTFKLDNLVEKLLIHEIYLQEETEAPTPQQGLALKSNDIEMQSDKSKYDEDESLAMITKGFKKMFEFKGIQKGSCSRRDERNPNGKFFSKHYANQNTYYGCGLPSRMIKDCPNIKKKNERTRFKSKREDKRAMVVTWSASDSFESESEADEIADICIMARES